MTKYTRILEAVRNRCLESLKSILIGNISAINVKDNQGWYAHHIAAFNNYTDCLEYLLEIAPQLINEKSFDGSSPLFLSVANSSYESTEILLKNFADPNTTDHLFYTPLHKAIELGCADTIELLLKYKANPNLQLYNKCTALHLSVKLNQYLITELLLKYHANLSIQDENGLTSVCLAAHTGTSNCLKLLIDYCLKKENLDIINKTAFDGASAVYLAAQEGQAECLRILIESGADINLKTLEPKAMALHAAMQFCHLNCVELLLPKTEKEELYNCQVSPFYFCFNYFNNTKGLVLLKMLIDWGLCCNKRSITHLRNNNYLTHIMSMCTSRYDYEVSPLTQLALEEGPLKYFSYLVDRGATIEPNSYNEMPVILAAVTKNNFKMIEYLIEKNVSLNNYHLAFNFNLTIIASRKWSMINFLLKMGAEVDSLFQFMNDKTDKSKDKISFFHMSKYFKFVNNKINLAQFILKCLDFTTNVVLPTDIINEIKHYEEYSQIEKIIGAPRTLQHLCRNAIRKKYSHIDFFKNELSLKGILPEQIYDYLLYN